MRNGFLDAATGAYVSDFELPPDVRIDDMAWEDDQHVLVSVSEGQARAILRVDLDGRDHPRRRRDRAVAVQLRRPALTHSPRVCNLPPPFRVLVAIGWRCAVHTRGQHTHRSGGDHGRQGPRPRRRVLGVHGGTAAEPAAYGVPAHRRPAHRRGPGADVAREAVPVLGQGRRSATPSTPTSAGSSSTSTTRCGAAAGRSASTPPTRSPRASTRTPTTRGSAARSGRSCRPSPGRHARSWCSATTSSSPRPRPPTRSASPSAPSSHRPAGRWPPCAQRAPEHLHPRTSEEER